MGRKANYDEKPKRGKGRKSRVQPPPPLLKQLKASKSIISQFLITLAQPMLS